MKLSKHGNKISLADHLADILVENLPESIENTESFLNSKDADKLIGAILDAVAEHVDAQVSGLSDSITD